MNIHGLDAVAISKLSQNIQQVTCIECSPPVSAKVLDGPAVVHMLSPGLSKTFWNYADTVFIPFVHRELATVSRLDIIWDRYDTDSLKNVTREKRGTGQRTRVTSNTKIPKGWANFLRVNTNKEDFFHFLALQCTATEFTGDKEFYVTDGVAVLSNSNKDKQTLEPCNHEEADTRIMVHVGDAAAQGHKKIMVCTVDTDVVVLAVSCVSQLPQLEELWVHIGTGKIHQFFPCHAIAASLGPDHVLPLFHAFSGCDTVSSFAGKRKKSAFETWAAYPTATEGFKHAKEGNVEHALPILERFVIAMYDRSCTCTDVKQSRKYLFNKKDRQLENLPPTKDALRNHILRAIYQGGHIWGQLLIPMQDRPFSANWGWANNNAIWEPVWTTLPPAAAACMELIRCRCKQNCAESCKYYIAPKTALCGHSLCHVCWTGRRVCPVCTAPLERKALRLNKPMQKQTKHVQALGEAFEKMFKVKLDEFHLDIPETIQPEKDSTKHVTDWLACSENNFSALPISSQPSMQESIHPIELSASNVQIHTETKKKESLARVILAPHCQLDWDKIETLPDTEEICKNKENVIVPMDIEPFFIDDNEYTTEHPRRSTRKKDLQHISHAQSCVISTDRHTSKNSSTDVDKKSLQNKQNWSSVKRMRKEFSKLNKQNRTKLNVSIEMCKKAQSTVSKSNTVSPSLVASQQVGYFIDDNTPDIMYMEKEQINDKKQPDSQDKGNPSSDKNVDNHKTSSAELNQVPNNTEISMQSQIVEDRQNLDLLSNMNTETEININNLSSDEALDNNRPNINNKPVMNSPETKAQSIPFLKKGDCYLKSNENDSIKVTKNVNTNVPSNTDDIEIAIKIGNTVTKILIKNKQKDLHCKVYTDCEVQTSLAPYGLNKKDASCSPFQGPNVTNVELSAGDAYNTDKIVPEGKSTSTKKNTASADTASAQSEIIGSEEKELSTVMDCVAVDTTNNKHNKQAIHSIKTVKNVASSQVQKVNSTESVKENQKLIDDLNDLDIFGSGSVKEANVQLLQSTKYTPSEILRPTLRNKKSQKLSDKRVRDVIDEPDIAEPSNKKHKIYPKKVNEDDEVPNSSSLQRENKVVAYDSENMNYDAIISQAFANIDADMRTIDNENSPKNIQNSDLTLNKDNIPRTQINLSQTNRNPQSKLTPKDKMALHDGNITELEERINEKFSENVFSILEKESEPQDGKNNKLPDGDSTQQHIDNLLTPGMCRDLVSSQHDNSQQNMDIDETPQELGTPVVEHDDSDKSIVEETPQKNLSFSKLKLNHDGSNKTTNGNKQSVRKPITNEDKNKAAIDNGSQSDSQIIKSIINLCDTTQGCNNAKEITVVANPDRNEALETPITINKFVNHIQHKSTPVARKSLNFDSDSFEDPEQTLCPTNTQEKEFKEKAFERTQSSQTKRPLGLKNLRNRENVKLCVGGSCLTPLESSHVKKLCYMRGWTFVDKFTKDLTHLVVGVDEENRAQRSVKYMCALATSKWIVSYNWVEMCLKMKDAADELPYEVLDVYGDPGPKRSRIAKQKIFEGMTFFCMPPFSVLDVDTLKLMLEAAGGRVVNDIQGVRVTAERGAAPALVLAEPEHTEDDRFLFLSMSHTLVPVNYEWALNSLGSYTLGSIHEHLLCPAALLPETTVQWPAALMVMTNHVV